MHLACDWLVDVAQVQSEQISPKNNLFGLQHKNWKGSFRGEYIVATQHWDFFGPTWHGGQAVKALAQAHQLESNPKYLRAAQAGAEFILGNQVTSGPDEGFITAYEELPDTVYTSAILESLDGLLVLGQEVDQPRYPQAALAAAKWCRDRAWIRGEGLVRDLYDPKARVFIEFACIAKDNAPGRPLADDAIFLKAYQLTGESAYRDAFYEIAHRLIRDERPSGNWLDFGPCKPATGQIHPRHAYWWGMPMIDAWQDSRESRWLDAACRAGEWYVKAQRNDGGLFRFTDHHFKTDCFGHATSGIMCAAIFWIRLFHETGDRLWLEPIRKAMSYAMVMQFRNPSDPNLKGCILEKVNPPDGTDRSPFYIRDLGTIFFVQAAAQLLLACEDVFGDEAGRRAENLLVAK